MEKWKESFTPTYSALKAPLPDNVHLLTLERIDDGKIILRFENFFEKSERGEVAEINLDELFKAFKITSVVEMNLSANQEFSKKRMMEWQTEEGNEKSNESKINLPPSPGSSNIIRLKPMEIRTFIIKTQPEMESNTKRNEVPTQRYVDANGYVVF